MSLETIEIETGKQPTASIIMLHGLGADGNDFVSLTQELNLSSVGPVRFLFPHAPMRPVTLNQGYVMRAWYDIFGTNLTQREDEEGLRASQTLVSELIAREKKRGIQASRIVLAGFSQGCAMSLLTGLRHDEPLAGLVGLSGYLPLAAKTTNERNAANNATPIFLAHGRQDTMVPFIGGSATRDTLIALGYSVEWHEYPMPHSVCLEELTDLTRWLVRILS